MACIMALLMAFTTAWAQPPNVIVILTDDQGWMDASVYGSQFYQTPNLDRLASQGVRFTNAYSASPLCSPTRLSVLTGQYPHRLGMTAPHGHLATIPLNTPRFRPGQTGAPWQAYLVPESARSLPNDSLTYGKLFKQAGYATAFMGKWHLGKPPYMPENHGFDVVVGGRGNPGPPGGFFAPWRSDTLPDVPKGTHIDDAITTEAIKFIRANQGKPFLLNLWPYSVHAPFQAKAPLIKKYRGLSDPRGEQGSAIMGAMIETLDHNLGRLLDELEALGLTQDTVIVFWSDNGGNMYNQVEGITPTNNAPLRDGKGNIHEGGIRVPAVISWPGVTKAGRVSDTVVSTIDIFPTLIQMTGITPPAGAAFDGMGLEPYLRGGELGRDTMFFHFPHYVPKPKNMSASAVRRGDYKLIRFYDRDGDQPYRYSLYDLAQDVGETNNLAAGKPELVRELDALITKHLQETGTPVPPPNPNFDPSANNPILTDGTPTAPGKPRPPQQTSGAVSDWLPNRGTTLSLTGGSLRVRSSTKDPGIRTPRLPAANGPVTIKVRMKVQTAGRGQAFWSSSQQKGFAGHSVLFDVQHNGGWHEYEIRLPSRGALNSVRLDPAQAPGDVEIDWIEVLDASGRPLKRWDFATGQRRG